jgi:two-component system chemotaxis sensor kinase CheA
VVRNAVDHGIESIEERTRAGKPSAGTLSLTTRLEGGELIIQIDDDGRGIDWPSITRRAQELGLPHQTQEDLVEALFRDGLSTRGEVNEYSGRGVGMGVVREACRVHGGKIRVESEPGRGTRVEFRFPQTASLSA